MHYSAIQNNLLEHRERKYIGSYLSDITALNHTANPIGVNLEWLVEWAMSREATK